MGGCVPHEKIGDDFRRRGTFPLLTKGTDILFRKAFSTTANPSGGTVRVGFLVFW